jgi:fumarate hydratase subunit beta
LKKQVRLPLTEGQIMELRAGDTIYLNGPLLSGRDAAHKRMMASLHKGQPLPIDITGETIYYVGPCMTPPLKIIGSAGPTTSGRMDPYAPRLIELGLKGMVGKGQRSAEVIEAMVKFHAIYFAALGGAGALIANSIKAAEIMAYPDLGPEAIYRFFLEDLPVIVAIDAYGNDLYQEGKAKYSQISS